MPSNEYNHSHVRSTKASMTHRLTGRALRTTPVLSTCTELYCSPAWINEDYEDDSLLVIMKQGRFNSWSCDQCSDYSKLGFAFEFRNTIDESTHQPLGYWHVVLRRDRHDFSRLLPDALLPDARDQHPYIVPPSEVFKSGHAEKWPWPNRNENNKSRGFLPRVYATLLALQMTAPNTAERDELAAEWEHAQLIPKKESLLTSIREFLQGGVMVNSWDRRGIKRDSEGNPVIDFGSGYVLALDLPALWYGLEYDGRVCAFCGKLRKEEESDFWTASLWLRTKKITASDHKKMIKKNNSKENKSTYLHVDVFAWGFHNDKPEKIDGSNVIAYYFPTDDFPVHDDKEATKSTMSTLRNYIYINALLQGNPLVASTNVKRREMKFMCKYRNKENDCGVKFTVKRDELGYFIHVASKTGTINYGESFHACLCD